MSPSAMLDQPEDLDDGIAAAPNIILHTRMELGHGRAPRPTPIYSGLVNA